MQHLDINRCNSIIFFSYMSWKTSIMQFKYMHICIYWQRGNKWWNSKSPVPSEPLQRMCFLIGTDFSSGLSLYLSSFRLSLHSQLTFLPGSFFHLPSSSLATLVWLHQLSPCFSFSYRFQSFSCPIATFLLLFSSPLFLAALL